MSYYQESEKSYLEKLENQERELDRLEKKYNEAIKKENDEPVRLRKPITQNVKDKVWNRDGGKCVQCGSNENLEFDHIIPHSKGGADTYRNLQLLCESCNRMKSAKIG